ncbi:MFS transporter [Planosporangium mesophilum]|uniref:Tetracycline resistance protein n=1 Tax=Planosporangium mesophilum TaxID=689768 RepID=A0A8J3WYV3_9ACTN|nr:MFS transporter [Planosporangium mesophilum]GII20554.1 tetracycline resistance protein [Planosporangium mesophilum]
MSPLDVSRVQRRTLSLLFMTQVVGGSGVAMGIAVGALLAAAMGGAGVSGLAASASVVGGALLAVPATRLIRSRGRRPGLVFAYACGVCGALVVVTAAAIGSVALLFVGMALFGGGSAANLQARYAAADLSGPDRRARHLSLIVWATTLGSVAGPNLAPLADRYAHRSGLPTYTGPFVISAVAFTVVALVIAAALRPDPLLVAREVGRDAVPAGSAAGPDAGPVAGPDAAPAAGLREAARAVRAVPAARLGVSAVAVGHLVMVGVMSMTPVHIGGYVHGDVLRVVGVVLSLHIGGMYALSPLVGWLTDRLGRRQVILGGLATLLVACAVAGTAGHHTPRLGLGLGLLGVGWSGTMIAGSTLLSESVGTVVRPAVQGLSDLVMGLSGAFAGAMSGLVVSWSGYPTLTLLAAIATVPLIALALRSVPALAISEGSRECG